MEAAELLARYPRAESDAWLELGPRLGRSCRLIGSATHCLHEWPEPGDGRADIDDHSGPGDERLTEAECARRRSLRRGRRNTTLWRLDAR